MNIERFGRDAIVETEQVCYTFKVSENPRDFEQFAVKEESLDWVNKDYYVGDWLIHPYGDNDNLPKEIQRVIQNSPIAPGELKRKVNLLWGKGPFLYKEEIKENELVREWVKDEQVQEWLNSWNYEEYLMKCAVDFQHLEGFFSKFHLNTGFTRAGLKASIGRLEHSQLDRTRKASRKTTKEIKATHVAVSKHAIEHNANAVDLKIYPLFDPRDPFKYKTTTLAYSNMYSFCQDYYTVPDLYGALEWIRRSNASAIILKALSKNGINPSFHIESPQEFWDMKEKLIKKNCEKTGEEYNYQMLLDYEQKILRGVAKVLSSEKNAGKFWHTKKAVKVDGTNLIEYGWTITPIKQNVIEYINAQEKISNIASSMINTSIGFNSAISGTGKDTKVNSGGEQHYALQNYLLTQNDIPESIVMKHINMALKINYPKKGLKMGFYHISAKRLEDTTPKDRPENQIT